MAADDDALGRVRVPKLVIWVLVGGAIAILSAMAWTWRGKKPLQTQGATGIDPSSILFTLPTICDQAPETVPNPIPDNPEAFRINEDDWRQVEFIVDRDLPQVEREMAAIEDFKHANRVGLGWKNVYVRKERPDGLFPSHLPYSLIDSIPHGPVQELVIESAGKEAMVKGGFAVRLSRTVFMYGRQSGGIIIDLGLSTTADQKESIPRQDLLVLCKKLNLIIADWCAGRLLARANE
jgi:hypothetical protein